MNARELLLDRVRLLVQELGELAERVTIVGGTTPALYPLNRTVSVRPTADIDLIVDTPSLGAWHRFVRELEARGFRYPQGEPVCRYAKGELVVDVMTTDASQLGFGNRWYGRAAATRMKAAAADVHVIQPIYFLATKLDAFADRGRHDPYSSHDLEDILVLVRGLPEVIDELAQGNDEVHRAVRVELGALLKREDALDLIRAHLEPDAGTQAMAPQLLQRLRRACSAND